MNDRFVLTDELLVLALRNRTDVPMPAGLAARVMAGATVLTQEPPSRPWLGWTRGSARRFAIPLPAIAGAAVAVAILVAVIAFQPVTNVPGTSSTSAPTPTTGAPASTAAPPTPEVRTLGTASALRLRLGNDVAPIDVISAFDSIWIADIHANDVRRFDPDTLAEISRVRVPGGPAWFVEADGALWVSTQNGVGVTRIDPATNTVVTTVGQDAPCAAPILVGGHIWQGACDADVFLEIDPATSTVLKRHPAEGHGFLVAVGSTFYTAGNDGLARWDAGSGVFTDLAAYTGPSGAIAVSDGTDLWVLGGSEVLRVDPEDGHTIASFPYPGAVGINFDPTRAWFTSGTEGLLAIDLASNTVVQQVRVPDPWIPRPAGDFVWVTDFNNSVLWRIEP